MTIEEIALLDDKKLKKIPAYGHLLCLIHYEAVLIIGTRSEGNTESYTNEMVESYCAGFAELLKLA